MELRNFNTLIRLPPKINSYTSVNSYLSGNLLSQLDLPPPVRCTCFHSASPSFSSAPPFLFLGSLLPGPVKMGSRLGPHLCCLRLDLFPHLEMTGAGLTDRIS